MIRALIHNIEGKWWLLIFVAGLYSVLAIIEVSLFQESLTFFWQTFIQIVPTVIIVFGLMFIFNLFVTTDMLVVHLGSSKKIRGWIIAIVSGIMSSGPIYMWFPLLSDLRDKGVRNSFLAAFLYSRSIKLPLLPMMIYYFGWIFTVVLTCYIIIFSVINGLVVRYFLKNNKKEVTKI